MTNWFAQLLALMLSPTKLAVTDPPHPSLAVTRLVSGAGIAAEVACAIRAGDDKSVRTVARAHCVADESHRHRTAAAVVAGCDRAGVGRRHARGAAHGHGPWTGDGGRSIDGQHRDRDCSWN